MKPSIVVPLCALVAGLFALRPEPGHAATAAPTKIVIPKPVPKKKIIVPLDTASGSQSGAVPSSVIDQYKQSKSLLAAPTAEVKKALDSVKGAGETNRSADAIEGVPLPADLSALRSTIITKASSELGAIDSNPSPPRTEPWSMGYHVKIGATRLAEYNAVAYGSNAWLWANPSTLASLISANKKHTTWCGIFALWAVKMGAGVTASNYHGDWDAVAKASAGIAPLLAFLGSMFTPEPDGIMPDKAAYKRLQWAPGAIYLYTSPDLDPLSTANEHKKKLSPTAIKNWLTRKGTVPPIRPGDIGYTQEPSSGGGVTHHHYIVERVMNVEGKIIYFTIEGNYYSYETSKAQSIIRNYRVYDPSYDPATAASGRHVIEAFYDIETLPLLENNRHTLPIEQQP